MSRVVQKFHMPDFDEYLSRDLGKNLSDSIIHTYLWIFWITDKKNLGNLIFTLEPNLKVFVEPGKYIFENK